MLAQVEGDPGQRNHRFVPDGAWAARTCGSGAPLDQPHCFRSAAATAQAARRRSRRREGDSSRASTRNGRVRTLMTVERIA